MMNIEQLSTQNLYQDKISRAKRTFDLVSSLIALILLAPVFPLIAMAIALTSRGPIFYRQLRVGKSTPQKMELFEIMKFRSMYEDVHSFGLYLDNFIPMATFRADKPWLDWWTVFFCTKINRFLALVQHREIKDPECLSVIFLDLIR